MIKNTLNLSKTIRNDITRNRINFRNCCTGIIDSVLDVVHTATGQQTFFIEQYHDEVIHVFNLMYLDRGTNTQQMPTDNYNDFVKFVFHNPESFKRLLQHIYTSNPDDKRFYTQLVDIIYRFGNPRKYDDKMTQGAFMGFVSLYYAAKSFHVGLNYPDFGACDYCLKHIGKYSKVKQHKKFLENANPDMWDFYKLQENGDKILDEILDETKNRLKK